MVTIFGSQLGPDQLVHAAYDASQQLPVALAMTRVLFDGEPAPLIYSWARQVSAIVPYRVSAVTKVRVEYAGRSSNEVALRVVPAAPGIFRIGGDSTQAVVVNETGDLNAPERPAARRSIVTLFATGEGKTLPSGIDGRLPVAGAWPVPALETEVTFGGIPGDIVFKGRSTPVYFRSTCESPTAPPKVAR